MLKKRTLTQIIKETSNSFPAILVTGPRQVGKTTLLKEFATSKYRYVTLDDFENRNIANTDPALFLQLHPPPVIIDEIQYAPELFTSIKIEIDQNREPGMFLLTGSQKFHLMKNITETLAGRIAIIDLLGLSQGEIAGDIEQDIPFIPTKEWLNFAKKRKRKKRTLMEIFESIWHGSFPQLITNKDIKHNVFYSSYIQTYITRDVQGYTKIGDLNSFHRFLKAAAARTGQIINYNDLARDVDIDPKTAKYWLSILEASGIIFMLQPYYANITKRIIKAPKLYFLDTGLCCYLTKWSSPETLANGAMSGAILETYIVSEIIKNYFHNGLEPSLYFYRDKEGKEIDLLIEQDQTLYPIEIKMTATPSKTSTKSFTALKNLPLKTGHGVVICFTPEILPLSREVDAVPVYCI